MPDPPRLILGDAPLAYILGLPEQLGDHVLEATAFIAGL
jgi:hypothetical protein